MTFAYHKLVIFLVHNEFESGETVLYTDLPIPAVDGG